MCFNCFQLIESGDVYVTAPDQLGETGAWHPQCFKCTTCQEFLVDLVYFYSEQKQTIFCGRHQAELLIPRCAACDQVVTICVKLCNTQTDRLTDRQTQTHNHHDIILHNKLFPFS